MKLNYKQFSKNLRQWIKYRGVTQTNLAKELGVTKQAVSLWTCSISFPNEDNLNKLACVLNTTVDDLLWHVKQESPNLCSGFAETKVGRICKKTKANQFGVL